MRSVDRVRDYFIQRQLPIEVLELPISARTAQLAADAVNTPLGSIVKSLIFIADTRAILALVAGDQRADANKIAQCAGATRAQIANAEQVRAHSSYAIGGVPPVAHPAQLETLVDETLLRFARVWAAAGAPNALFEIELKLLLELTHGRVADIVVTSSS
ncbi:MAG: YbaK/EbsC family protein [Chloroflexi bacterium]|nr:YbaK/EbsC family protein [Chloroflexota bacterium]